MKPQIRTTADKIGVEVFTRMPDMDGYPKTHFSDDIAAASSNGATLDASFLAANDYVILGKLGTPTCEIMQVQSITSSTTITFTGSTVFAHAQGEQVTYIPVNRLKVEESTDSGSNYTVLATQTLKVSNPEHYYNATSATSASLIRVRFENQTTSKLTAYSDALLGAGYADNTVYAVKKAAVEDSGMKMADLYDPEGLISDTYLNQALQQARRIVHNAPGQKGRWEFRQKYDEDIGRTTAGTISMPVPTDLEDPNTMTNVLSVRIGSHRTQLHPMTKREWNEAQQGRAHTTIATAISSTSDTSIVLTDSGDFEESGTISAVTSGTEDTIDYTANDESTNTISGVTNITVAHAADIDVWQNPGFGLPTQYTIFEGRIYFNLPIHPDYHNENVYMDYYAKLTESDSDNDSFDEPDYDMFVPYLKWKIRQKRDEGVTEDKDRDYIEFTNRVGSLLSNEVSDSGIKLVPQLPHSEDDEDM